MSLSCYDTFWDDDGCGLGGELCQVRLPSGHITLRAAIGNKFGRVQPFEQSEWIAVRCPGRCAWQPISKTYTDTSQMANALPFHPHSCALFFGAAARNRQRIGKGRPPKSKGRQCVVGM
jgi:hypothetical protein